jgi:hypothetical protein
LQIKNYFVEIKKNYFLAMLPDPIMLASGDIFNLERDFSSQLLNVPSRERLGVQAVLARHGHRVRSLSVSSDRSGYSGQMEFRSRKTTGTGYSRKLINLIKNFYKFL